jgi:hypothetical protein
MKFFALIILFLSLTNLKAQSLKNGSFELGLTPWMLIGNSQCNLEILESDSSAKGVVLPKKGTNFLKVTNDTAQYFPCNIANGFKITPQNLEEIDFSFGGLIHSNDSNINYNFRINFFSGSNLHFFDLLGGFTNSNSSLISGKGITINKSSLNFGELIDSVQIVFKVSYAQSKSFNWYLDDVMINFKTASINNTLSNNIYVYPNPTKGIINIEGNQKYYYNLFDAKGNRLNTSAILEDNVIDISMLSDGFYFLELTNNQGQVIRKKIIKN